MAELILPRESYDLIGLLFEVYNELGPTSYQEKHFQKAFEIKLKRNNIPFKSQVTIPMKIDNSEIGKSIVDLIVFEPPREIVIELKRSKYIELQDIRQINRYIEEMNIKLGIIVNASRNGKLVYKRIINSKMQPTN